MWFQLLARWPSAVAVVPLAAIAFFWTGHRPAQLLAAHAARSRPGRPWARSRRNSSSRRFPTSSTASSKATPTRRPPSATAGATCSTSTCTNLSDLARVMSRSFWFLHRRRGRRPASCSAPGATHVPRRSRPASALVLLTPTFILSGRAHGGVEPFGGIGLPLLLARSLLIPMYVLLAILVGGIALARSRDRTHATLRGLAVIAALLAAPFLGGLGSNNPLWYSAAMNPGLLDRRPRSRCARSRTATTGGILVHGLAFAFAVLIAFTAFDGTWRHPYRQAPARRRHRRRGPQRAAERAQHRRGHRIVARQRARGRRRGRRLRSPRT